MREILFRGKRKDTSEWTEGLTVLKLDKYVYMCKSSMCEITYDLQHNIKAITSKNPFFVEVIPETVGQYTGLNDLHGTKIFEGDIIKYCPVYDDVEEIGYIKWSKNNAAYLVEVMDGAMDGLYANVAKKCEIIGNVNENLELLGGDE